MNTLEAISARHSVRAFLDRPVGREKIEQLLAAASRAPSGANTQPWQVAVLSGSAKTRLQTRFEQAFRSQTHGKMDYPYYPEHWRQPYLARRRACGLQLYQALEIDRADKQRQADQWAANYRAFDAPVMLLLLIDGDLCTGSYMDCGMFIQTLMLAAVELGLGTCPQAALAEYPDIVRDELDLADETRVLCGIALGYEDHDAPVNAYRTPREPVERFTRFYED